MRSKTRKPGETRGRKPLFKDNKLFTFSIELEIWETLEKIAKEKNVSVSSLIRKAIDDYLGQMITVEVEINPDNLTEGVF